MVARCRVIRGEVVPRRRLPGGDASCFRTTGPALFSGLWQGRLGARLRAVSALGPHAVGRAQSMGDLAHDGVLKYVGLHDVQVAWAKVVEREPATGHAATLELGGGVQSRMPRLASQLRRTPLRHNRRSLKHLA